MSFLSGGQKTPQIAFNPTSGYGGGLNTVWNPGTASYSTTPSAARTAAVGDVANTYTDLAGESAGLRGQVTPGFNALLDSQLGSINDSARSAVGDLKRNLQSRRILGSSFGQDTLTRANAEFSKQRKDTIAQNFLQSLDASNKLLQQEYQARTQAAQTGLTELNLEAGVANNLIGSTNQILAQNAQAQAKMEAEAQAGAGKFMGGILGSAGQSLFGPSLSSAGTGLSSSLGSLFGGSAAAGSAAAGAGMGTAAASAELLAALGPLAAI